MAETALGVVGLLALFSTAVDCFDYVRIAKTFDRDFSTAQLKLDNTRIRLSRWGEALEIHNDSNIEIPAAHYRQAEKVLKHLESLFAQTQSKAEIFAPPETLTYEIGDMGATQALVHRGMVAKARKRIDQALVSRLEKTKWALYKRKELNSLIEDIAALVGQLDQIMPPNVEPQRRLQSLVEIEVEEIQELARNELPPEEATPLQIVETLHEAADGVDPYLEQVVERLIRELHPEAQESTTTYNVTQRMGDVKDNKGILTAVNHGSQTNYYGSG